ncbi:MAG: RlmE family RNA methyltransferase [Gallionellaceae bacterium]|nr:RlmE family RNA methyltransferase [Gallionellaceae bacterium]
MKRQAKSHAWHHQHVNDFYVRQSVEQGWRSRAAFKLTEIDDRDKLLRPGQTVVDLGCAPGGWCQVAASRLKGQGRIVGVDLLEMVGIGGVTFIQGDFTEDAVLAELEAAGIENGVDLVLSDMAPNISGVDSADQARSYYLAELALDFARQHLKADGAMLIKVFQGSGFEEYVKQLRAAFRTVAVRKPKASRDRSREVYLLARGLIGQG